MGIFAIIVAGILVSLAAMHLIWATGSHFPAPSEGKLVAMVVGFRGRTEMPGAMACTLVAAILVIVAMSLLLASGTIRTLILGGSALVFLLRGLAAYLPSWRRLTPQQPFAALDQRLYGPLCQFLGVSLIILVS